MKKARRVAGLPIFTRALGARPRPPRLLWGRAICWYAAPFPPAFAVGEQRVDQGASDRQLTYNATSLKLSELESAGQLVRFSLPLLPGETQRRSMYVTPQISRWLNQKPSLKRSEVNPAFVRQTLGRFVKGEFIDNMSYMNRLARPPDEVWDIRVTTVRPQARVFGAFAGPDCFVSLHSVPRSWLGSERRKPWPVALDEARARWKELFGDAPPFTSTRFEHYVTENSAHYDWSA